MGGKRYSSMSFCTLCFGRSPRGDDEVEWEWEREREKKHTRRVRPSDEDRGRWIGEPDVDKKASDFIARFYASRFMDSEPRAIVV
ncbi:unnamed protein product [Musa hybrid cultivar]